MKRRVLILIKGLGRGGAEQLLVSAAPYWDRERFEYEVAYLLPWKDAFVKDFEDLDVPVHCLDGTSRGLGWLRRFRRLVGDREIDLVHSHSPHAAVGARIGAPRGIRLVYTEHNLWKRYRRVTYWANALSFARNDHVFTVSDNVRSFVGYPRALRVLSMPTVETLYHGLDPDAVARWAGSDGVRAELGIPEGAPVIGTIANFKHHKGHGYLLEAAARVRTTLADLRVVLIGQGPLEGEIRRRAHQLDLDETIVFAGYREDAPRLAGGFDLFVLPSIYEGLSIALIEAMALGVPAVVSDAGGLPEVVRHGREGVVIPARDPAALADALVSLLQDRSLRERLGEAARQRAATFDIRKAVHRMEEVYQELLG